MDVCLENSIIPQYFQFMSYRILLLFLVLSIPFCAQAQERIVPQEKEQITLSFAPLVKRVAPAVVNIYTKRVVAGGYRHPFMDDPFFGNFFRDDLFGGMRQQVENSLGSGVIVEKDGLVVTNSHVVRGAELISVVLADGQEFEADLVLDDPPSDLAILKIKAGDGQVFPFAALRSSEALEVGDLVLAIGNPFGVGQTVTSGIVSAQGRSSLDINDYNFFIQTDAAINPGNSGGALVAMDGGVVGINTAIYSRSGGSMGIGFAIPSEMAANVLASAKNGAKSTHGVVRSWWGVQVQDVTQDIAVSLGMEKASGALVSRLHAASPMAKAGVKVGDVIMGVNGHDIKNAGEMKFRMATVLIGDQAQIKVLRAGKVMDFALVGIAAPDVPPRAEVTIGKGSLLAGATLANINPAVVAELGADVESEGVVVLRVERVSAAGRILREGDLLLEINGVKIEKTADVENALAQQNPLGGLGLVLSRNGRISNILIR